MHGGQTSAVQGEREESVNDLRLRAINAERLTLFLSSHQRADRCFAVIALARIARRNREPKTFRLEFFVINNSRASKASTGNRPRDAVRIFTRLVVKTALKHVL